MNIINALTDEKRRYKTLFIPDHHARMHGDPWVYLADRLNQLEPGTLMARIYYDLRSQGYGIVLFNESWSSVPLGEILPTYEGPAPQSQLPDPTIIDVEFNVENTKELGNNGKAS